MGKPLKTDEVCEFFGVSKRTVSTWKNAGAPCRSGGKGRQDIFDSEELHRWLVTEAAGGGSTDPEIRQARLEILRTEGELRKIRLRQRQGEIVEADAVAFIMQDLFIGVRTAFRTLTPWLWNEAAVLVGTDNQRMGMHLLNERINTVVFSVYVAGCRAFADIANRSGGRAEKMAAEAWKAAFGREWEAEFDRLVETGFENDPKNILSAGPAAKAADPTPNGKAVKDGKTKKR